MHWNDLSKEEQDHIRSYDGKEIYCYNTLNNTSQLTFGASAKYEEGTFIRIKFIDRGDGIIFFSF